MINPILEDFPHEVIVQDVRYAINADFKLWLRLFLYSRKKDTHNVNLILHDICPEIETAENPQVLIDALVDFSMLVEHVQNEDEKRSVKGRFATAANRLFDLFVDSDVIYADFMRDYHIDLNTAEMHWLKFKLLLNGLTGKSATEQRKSFRATDIKDVAVKHRESFKTSLEAMRITDDNAKMTLEERNRAMIDYVASRQREARKGEAKN